MDSEPIFSMINAPFSNDSYKDDKLPITYPADYWKKTPLETRLALVDNLALATTMHLPIVFNVPEIEYDSGRPLLELRTSLETFLPVPR